MPPGSFNFICFATLGVALVVPLVLWKQPWLGLALGGAVTIMGWAALCAANEADIDAELRKLNTRAAQGEKLSPEDQMYDGTGDRVAVLFTGWFPGITGMAVGSSIAILVRLWASRRRHHYPLELTDAARPLRVIPMQQESGPDH